MHIAKYERLVNEDGLFIPLEIDCEESDNLIGLSFDIPKLKARNEEVDGDQVSVYRVETDKGLTTSTIVRKEQYHSGKWHLVENPKIISERFHEILGKEVK